MYTQEVHRLNPGKANITRAHNLQLYNLDKCILLVHRQNSNVNIERITALQMAYLLFFRTKFITTINGVFIH